MLSRIEFQNYRSFLDVKVNLSLFTLVVGANGSGKSNFLQFFAKVLCDDNTF
ncbi:MAG: AAA family ATPase, partial [Cyanobacteria bacterium P01_F01_bin.143]